MRGAEDVIRNFGGKHARGGEVAATVGLASGTDDSLTPELPTSVFVHPQLPEQRWPARYVMQFLCIFSS
jgi:hypothetical protein